MRSLKIDKFSLPYSSPYMLSSIQNNASIDRIEWFYSIYKFQKPSVVVFRLIHGGYRVET